MTLGAMAILLQLLRKSAGNDIYYFNASDFISALA